MNEHMVTDPRVLQYACKQALDRWSVSEYYPRNPITLAVDQHNLNVLYLALSQLMQKGVITASPTPKEVSEIVEQIKGQLKWVDLSVQPKSAAETQAAAQAGIPHQDLFPGINTVEKAVNLIRTKKLPNGTINQFNELLKYLQDNNIRQTAVQKIKDEPANTPMEDGEIALARTMIDNLRPSDIATVRSDARGGRWSQLIDVQRALLSQLERMKAQHVPGKNIKLHVESAINDLRDPNRH